ncbi:hypothetical protein B0H14DRAFT_2609637 [Mycena olivaceomarginata]|nr:hypothetical protein B0H14DRAFT_2609637 [Mycena olivaceomarginata]
MGINFDPDCEMRIRQLQRNASANSYRTRQRSLRHTSRFFPLTSSKKQLQAKLKAVRASRKPTPAPKKGKENKASKPLPEKKERGAPTVRLSQRLITSPRHAESRVHLQEPLDAFWQTGDIFNQSSPAIVRCFRKKGHSFASIARESTVSDEEDSGTGNELTTAVVTLDNGSARRLGTEVGGRARDAYSASHHFLTTAFGVNSHKSCNAFRACTGLGPRTSFQLSGPRKVTDYVSIA